MSYEDLNLEPSGLPVVYIHDKKHSFDAVKVGVDFVENGTKEKIGMDANITIVELDQNNGTFSEASVVLGADEATKLIEALLEPLLELAPEVRLMPTITEKPAIRKIDFPITVTSESITLGDGLPKKEAKEMTAPAPEKDDRQVEKAKEFTSPSTPEVKDSDKISFDEVEDAQVKFAKLCKQFGLSLDEGVEKTIAAFAKSHKTAHPSKAEIDALKRLKSCENVLVDLLAEVGYKTISTLYDEIQGTLILETVRDLSKASVQERDVFEILEHPVKEGLDQVGSKEKGLHVVLKDRKLKAQANAKNSLGMVFVYALTKK